MIDNLDEYNPEYVKPQPTNFNDYKGMSKEGEEAYNKRQDEPLVKKASDIVPMAQVQKYYDNLKCGHKGCKGLVRDKSYYACIVHQAIQAIGTDFFLYYRLLNDNDLDRMSTEQYTAIEKRREYMQRWLDNFPRGATD